MRIRRSLMLGLVALTAMACGGGDPASPDNGGDGGGNQQGDVVEIDLVNFSFSPSSVTISPGTTVRWKNTTTNTHTVTPDGHTAWSEWQTNTPNQTFEVTFDEPGTYPYYCMPHRSLGMTGTITVQ